LGGLAVRRDLLGHVVVVVPHGLHDGKEHFLARAREKSVGTAS
jgi:hypothetical protein